MKPIVVILAGVCLVAGARGQTFADGGPSHIEQVLVTDAGSTVLRDENLDVGVRVVRISAHRGRPFQPIVDGISDERGRCFRLIVDDVSA